jgi:hypothetical protein
LYVARLNNRKLYLAYTTVYPQKVTYFNVNTIEDAKVCFYVTGNLARGHKILCALSAGKGNLLVLQLLRNELGCVWDESTCSTAARNGRLEVLQWARANDCPWNENTCAYAACVARYGHLDVLKWAHANGFTWDASTCAVAARFRHLEVLQWARANDCPGMRLRVNLPPVVDI